ncbi:hypothetical protein AGDE_12888 [Angomonas deanei]|uniref:Uncharacterized protein n=1 Tax=Angomonas deanei TaxID=59799 RepID=A0A7G2C3U1_9TRYP|nr:hypothetical protein AGDE_12888 [Angomonas deanei]CAD2213387.1 hypothetical protein, conserved [Angomonas deanei]|eukprot:EPY23334.1 hypothetical protein AGDE_12888 [Angomonas deanei]
MEQNGSVTKEPTAIGLKDREEEEERERKRKQIAYIQKKRNQSKNRFDQVENMYSKAMERRLKAMEHITNDPPADRLVGRNMVSHIPAAQMKRSTYTKVADTPPVNAPQPSTRHNDNVQMFLTELDSTDDGPMQGRRSPRPTRSANQNDEIAAEMGTSQREKLVDEHAENWRELGYDVVLVDSRGGLQTSKKDTKTAPREAKKKGTAYDEYAWMKLAPMPPVCLVQKRLVDDGVNDKFSQSKSSSKRGPR